MNKIGVGITTYNKEVYLQALYNSLPLDKIDELVVVNGGEKYKGEYNCDWIQHNKNRYPAVCRNDCLTFLMNKHCEHIFLIEDDMIIKDPNIFQNYINASKESNIKYLHYVSTSWESGSPNNRTPLLSVEYKNNVKLSFYSNMCNEFTYRHCSLIEKYGLYDDQFKNIFDIDMTYRYALNKVGSKFWWFADIFDSDKMIMNNPETVSRLNANNERNTQLLKEFALFHKKYNINVRLIPRTPQDEFVKYLKEIKNNV